MISTNKLNYVLNDGYVWVGMCGYDTRPFVLIPDESRARPRQEIVPVGYDIGYADGRPEGVVPRGDVRRYLERLPVGAVVVAPDYSGCHFVGEYAYSKTDKGWRERYHAEE